MFHQVYVTMSRRHGGFPCVTRLTKFIPDDGLRISRNIEKNIFDNCGILFAMRVDTWKLYLFLEHQYQPVSSFLLPAAILVYPYLLMHLIH